MAKLPIVKLNTTLTDLYRQASPSNAGKRIGQVLCGASSVLDLTSEFPRSIKYIFQDRTYNTASQEVLSGDDGSLRHSMAVSYLSLVPQREAFLAGDTIVFLFNVDELHEQVAYAKQEAEKTLEVLLLEQRPRLVFCPGPKKIPLQQSGIDMLNYKISFDSLAAYPLVVDLDTHWRLNTKAALARSGLPTPRCKILDLESYSMPATDCCAVCRASDPYYIPLDCDGNRGRWLTAQINRTVGAINSHPLPFVLKNQQSYGGAGTYVIKTEQARQQLVHDMSSCVLRRLFSQVTEQNYYLSPGTILLSDMVNNKVDDYGLTFFVTEAGEGIFLSVSDQMLSDAHAWLGSIIDYKRQKELKDKFSRIMADIAAWLNSEGYFGPAGADILETRDGDKTMYQIVDLNVRTPGSLCLPLLKDHFESRGMHSASSFFITTHDTRAEFILKWQEALESGQMCIMSWCEDREARCSLADIAISAEDHEQLEEMVQRVREATESFTL